MGRQRGVLFVFHILCHWSDTSYLFRFYNVAGRTPQRTFLNYTHFLPTVLERAFKIPFLGNAANDFVAYLHSVDADVLSDQKILYAKAFSVIQSSGTGKSRMLTEVQSCSSFIHVT